MPVETGLEWYYQWNYTIEVYDTGGWWGKPVSVIVELIPHIEKDIQVLVSIVAIFGVLALMVVIVSIPPKKRHPLNETG